MACLILYRLLKWIEQHCLGRENININAPDYSAVSNDEELFKKYKQKYNEIHKDLNREATALPDPISLVDGFLVLHALGHEIVEDLDWGKLKNGVQTRNKCIYAHGMSMINDKEFKAFKSTVENLFKKAQNIAEIDPDIFNEQHKFIVPFP